MIKIKIIVLITLYACNCALQAQSQSGDIFKKVLGTDAYDELLQKNIFSLQKAPQISIEDLINSKVSELLSLGKFFKYHNELERGCYRVMLDNDQIYLYILKKPDMNINFNNANKSLAVNGIKDKIEFRIHKIDDYAILEMTDYNKNIDEKGYLDEISKESLTGPSSVNFAWKPNIIIDKQILNNLTQYVSGKILNQSVTLSKLCTIDQQPCQLYSDVTASTIVPYGNGSRAKVFTVDKNWNRIIWWDKDRAGLDFGPITLFNPVNPGQYYSLNMPSDIVVGTSTIVNNGHNYNGNVGTDTYYPLFIADQINNRIIRIKYQISIQYDPGQTNTSYILLDNSFTVIKSNIPLPYSLSLHQGSNTTSDADDILWYTEGTTARSLVAINPNNGSELQRIPTIRYQERIYPINAGRMSIYRSPDGLRNVISLIDESRNVLYFLPLNSNGLASGTPGLPPIL